MRYQKKTKKDILKTVRKQQRFFKEFAGKKGVSIYDYDIVCVDDYQRVKFDSYVNKVFLARIKREIASNIEKRDSGEDLDPDAIFSIDEFIVRAIENY